MHLELKTPLDKVNVFPRYRYKDAVRYLHEMIDEYKMAEFCMVQSFDHNCLREFEMQNQEYKEKVATIYLQNWLPDVLEHTYEELASPNEHGSGSHL